MVSSKNVARALYQLSKDKNLNIQVVLPAFFAYTEKYNLVPFLPNILKHLENFNTRDQGHNTLYIKSGLLIDKKITDDIKNFISQGQESAIKTEIDPRLIAGFVATYKGYIYDASIRNQLQLLKKELTNA